MHEKIVMNKFGMNLLLWGTEMNEDMFPVLEQIREAGYDGVEVPIFNTDPAVWKSWRNKLDTIGLDRIAVTINGPDHHQIAADPAMRKKTLERNKRALDCAAVLGSTLLTGPYHSALGVFAGRTATPDEINWAAENLHQLAEYAQSLGITLGLEFLNRFESYLVSCTDELIELADKVNHPHCKLMFDSFHANIEEKDMAEAIHRMGSRLVHVQLSENDRGTLGAGHVDFESILAALASIGYAGMISVEAFSSKLTAANIWRPLFESEEQLVKDSIHYLKNITQS
jgi:D-psicose/D-tagatose/L-ribulose 3-epimerase